MTINKIIKKAHDAITRIKGKEYAPTSTEIQKQITMAQQKLYTEEQVREAMRMSDKYYYLLESEEDDIITSLTPIEVPSDEEIKKYADFVMPDAEKIGGEAYTAYRGIKLGAKWMRDKILNK